MSTVVAPPPPAATTRESRGISRAWTAAAPIAGVIAITAAVFVLLVVGFTDVGPWQSLQSFASGAVGSVDAMSETMTRAIPLAIIGAGAAIALRAGVFNVGGESQMVMGAVAAVVVARPIESWPAVVVWVIAMAAAVIGGAAWVAVPAVLWVKRGVSEILSTLLLNFITAALVAWLLANTYLHDPDPSVITPQGERLPDNLEFPLLIHGSRLHLGIYVALATVVVTAWAMRTSRGFRIDLVGANPSLAAQSGARPVRLRLAVLFASAGLAGLAGAVQLFGLSHRLTTGLTGGVGYTGLLVAVIARARPLPTALAALVFAAIVTGGEAVERDGVPRTLSAVIQCVLIIGLAVVTRRQRIAR